MRSALRNRSSCSCPSVQMVLVIKIPQEVSESRSSFSAQCESPLGTVRGQQPLLCFPHPNPSPPMPQGLSSPSSSLTHHVMWGSHHTKFFRLRKAGVSTVTKDSSSVKTVLGRRNKILGLGFFFFFLALLSVLDIPLENVSDLFYFLIGVELLYSFVFISIVQHESAISIDMSPPSWTSPPPSFHPTSLGHNSCAVHQLPISCFKCIKFWRWNYL